MKMNPWEPAAMTFPAKETMLSYSSVDFQIALFFGLKSRVVYYTHMASSDETATKDSLNILKQ